MSIAKKKKKLEGKAYYLLSLTNIMQTFSVCNKISINKHSFIQTCCSSGISNLENLCIKSEHWLYNHQDTHGQTHAFY